jgi:nicotinamidase-related amidase
MKLAFIIIDMQKQFRDELCVDPNFLNAIEHMNYVANLARKHHQQVVIVKDIEGFKDTDDARLGFIEEVPIEKDDIIIKKEYSNAFWKTGLEAALIQQGIDYIVISGFAAEHCVLGTYLGAKERGYTTAILQNGIVSTKPDVVTATYRDREIVSYSTLEYLLKGMSAYMV